MIVSINQPAYLPWLGYFDRIEKSDLHIVLDHVQFEKGSYTNRCQVPGSWLTVPVHSKGFPKITDVTIADTGWHKKHLKTLRQLYGNTAHWPHHKRFLEAIYAQSWNHLS